MKEKADKTEISKTVLKGIPGCPCVQDVIAHLVSDPSELDTVKEGEILVCKMTNPAWVVSFSKISALVTDTGGALSHPAVVAREFGVPCVLGTRRATPVSYTHLDVYKRQLSCSTALPAARKVSSTAGLPVRIRSVSKARMGVGAAVVRAIRTVFRVSPASST